MKKGTLIYLFKINISYINMKQDLQLIMIVYIKQNSYHTKIRDSYKDIWVLVVQIIHAVQILFQEISSLIYSLDFTLWKDELISISQNTMWGDRHIYIESYQ